MTSCYAAPRRFAQLDLAAAFERLDGLDAVAVRDRSGSQRNEKIGPAWMKMGRTPAGHFTKKSAQEWLDARLTELRNEALPPPGASEVTFKQACDEWLRYVEHDRQRAASTIRDYRNAVGCYLLPEFGPATPLIDIDSDRIDIYRDRLLAEGEMSRRTAQKVLVLLHGVLKRAVRKKWLAANPAENVEKITLTRSGDFNVLKPVEVEELRRAGQKDGLLAAAILALHLEEPEYRREFDELYGESLEAMQQGDLMPATIPDTFGPDD